MRRTARLPVSLLILISLGPPLAAQQDPIAQGDAWWARRAEGHKGQQAAAGPIDQAIAAYERAVREKPDRLEGSWKLLRALHYKGDYVVRSKEDKQKAFGRGREVVEAALDQMGRRVGGRKKLDDLPTAEAAKLVKGIPEAPYIYAWGGIHWGLWGEAYGKMAAARQGVGDKIRRYGEIALALDERFERAAAHRLLGRLHSEAPKIPFITGWVDRDKAISHLRRAVALGPEDLHNHLYLADALLQYQPEKAAAAKGILRSLVQKSPDPSRVVEEERVLANARELLARSQG